MTDWHTDRLAREAVVLSGSAATVFTNLFSRLVVDPERFPDEVDRLLIHAPPVLRERTAGAFESVTTDSAHDAPFAGTYVPTRHYTIDQRVRSVMVEIRRDVYLEEPSDYREAPADRLVGALSSLIRALDGE
jgi:N-formylglutamate amidohydrolase